MKGIDQKNVLRVLKKGKCGKNLQKVEFERYVARNNDLLASVDVVKSGGGYTFLELKTHRNKKLLIKAMRYVMREYSVVQTTHGKLEVQTD